MEKNNYLKRLIPYALPYKKYAILNIISNIFYALFSTLSFIALMPMLDIMFGSTTKITTHPILKHSNTIIEFFDFHKVYYKDLANFYVTTNSTKYGEMNTLTYMVVAIMATFFLKNIASYLSLYFITFLRNGVLKDLRNDVYQKILNLPIAYYSEKRKGDIMARVLGDINTIQTSFLSVLELLVREPLTILFTIIAMFAISVKLTIFVFIFIPISGYLISLVGKTLKKHSTKVQEEQGKFLSIIEETLGGLKIIKGFNGEHTFKKKFNKSTLDFYNYANALGHRQNLASPTSEFLGIAVITALLWYGGKMVLIEHALAPGAFLGYMGLAYNILTPAKQISRASYSVKQGDAAAQRVLEVLDTPNPMTDVDNAISIDGFKSEIQFHKVSFKYEDDYVLENFSLKVPKGSTVALVGQSGSGKSTIANLVTRFYDVNKGKITIDGNDIRDITKHSLRAQMGLVTQDPILFHDTIANNIAFGKEASEEDIINAAKIANAHEFILEQPLGYQTSIGDSGNKLSGGQKQRISIARAILKNPPIMILDEATSALDTESEKAVQDALENLMKNRTSIVIAHRLSTIQKADLIVVMQKGKIVEQGTHEELIIKDGTYNKLVNMQSL